MPLAPKDDDIAIKNIADYWLETKVMQSMSQGQLRAGYLSTRAQFELGATLDTLDYNRPMIIETLHHHCLFSIAYVISQLLHENHGFNKVVLLHLKPQPDPRIALSKSTFNTYFPKNAADHRRIMD